MESNCQIFYKHLSKVREFLKIIYIRYRISIYQHLSQYNKAIQCNYQNKSNWISFIVRTCTILYSVIIWYIMLIKLKQKRCYRSLDNRWSNYRLTHSKFFMEISYPFFVIILLSDRPQVRVFEDTYDSSTCSFVIIFGTSCQHSFQLLAISKRQICKKLNELQANFQIYLESFSFKYCCGKLITSQEMSLK